MADLRSMDARVEELITAFRNLSIQGKPKCNRHVDDWQQVFPNRSHAKDDPGEQSASCESVMELTSGCNVQEKVCRDVENVQPTSHDLLLPDESEFIPDYEEDLDDEN